MLLASVGAKDDPASGGRQMPSHWGHRRLNIPSQSSATGTQCLHAVGCAEAGVIYQRVTEIPDRESQFHDDEVTYVSIGDGATSEGEFWESLNTTCTKKLPILYLCEDNGYAISVPVEVQTPGGDISRIVEHFPGASRVPVRRHRLPRQLPDAAARRSRTCARGRGPAFVHATVIRPYSHSLSDDEKLYKTPAEREAEARRDPLLRMRHFLKTEGLATDDDFADILASVEREVNAAAEQALAAPKPEPDTATLYVFSPDVDPTSSAFATEPQPAGPAGHDGDVDQRHAAGRDGARSAHRRLRRGRRRREPRGSAGTASPARAACSRSRTGCSGSTAASASSTRRWPRRTSSDAAVGMSLRGLKPVVEIQFFDYIWPAFMQIRDEMAMMRYRSSNNWSCPMVIRVPIGGYLRGGAPYHSQSGVAIFAHSPGIRIVFPSNAQDAAGLLRTAIRCDDPVLFLEHKHLYRQTYNKGPNPGTDYMLPFGKAAVAREGTDVVVFTWGALVQRSLLAAQQAERDGISVAVIDLRTIIPYDWETIAAYTRKTNRVIVVHEDQLTCGFGAEIAARISQELFEYLDAPVTRVASLDCPVAYAPVLEEVILPDSPDILKAIRTLVAY